MSLRASHLLIKHQGSRNPVSRRTNVSTANVTREAAIAELTQILSDIKAGKVTFEAAAFARSDCGSYVKHGDLGEFGPGEMMKAFEDATRALSVGEISDIVETDSGSHIIKRTK
eukprot:Tbor_TRINITY_DN5393_c4_g3::TRINITY_DN5393_c4_g3_i1::g.4791::m.4791/K09578/PIN1; peptidyl-prolyl cis-trans isomerase NIMA-interacting 1